VLAHSRCGEGNCPQYPVMRTAAANVAVERRRDLGSRGRGVAIEQCLCRDQYAGEAIAALAGLFVDKGLL
jgi:hypothetical protein